MQKDVLANLNTVTDKTVVNAKNDLTAKLRGSLDKDEAELTRGKNDVRQSDQNYEEEEERQRVGRTGGTN